MCQITCLSVDVKAVPVAGADFGQIKETFGGKMIKPFSMLAAALAISATSPSVCANESVANVPSERAQKDESQESVLQRREARASTGNPVQQATLAEDLYWGKFGLRVDRVRAAAWYRKAAEGGLAHAQYSLGVMYGVDPV